MSAEAPKEAGTTASITPQIPEGGLRGFLKRLFADPSESQHTQRSVSRIVQPPPDLEDFATKIQQGIDDHLAAQRQQELDRRNAEAARLSAEAAEKDQAVARQRVLEQARATAQAEAQKIMRDLQVEERLRYIQQTVWEGKGIIRPIGSDLRDRLGGLELVHEYPGCREITEGRGGDGSGYLVSKYVQQDEKDSVSLSILVLKVKDSEEGKKELSILSVTSDPTNIPGWYSGAKFFEARIPIETEDTKALLDAILIQETVQRLKWNLIPGRLETEAKRKLLYAAYNHGWRRCSDGALDSWSTMDKKIDLARL